MADPGWSIATGSQSSDTQLTTSGSCTATPQPLKFQRIDAAPATSSSSAVRAVVAAEGSLVQHGRRQKSREEDSLSNVSATSSNKLLILRAKLDLEQALLREKQQETSVARLRCQIAEEEEEAGEQLNLSGDLSEIMRADDLREKPRSNKRCLKSI